MFLAKVGGALVRGSKSAGPMVVPLRNVARVRGLDNVKIPDLKAMPRIKLNSLKPVPGAVRPKIRVGRGRSSRRGKTAGRGHKGTGQHGHLPFWFQGGQTPSWLVFPKRGRPSVGRSVKHVPLNVGKLVDAIEEGRLDPKYPINTRHLWEAKVITGSIKSIAQDRWGVKLLGTGAERLKVPIDIEVQRASQSAIKAVEAAGGKIACKWYNPLGLRALLQPHKFKILPRIPLPPPKKIQWYKKPENRGVLTDVTADTPQVATVDSKSL